MTNAQRFIAAYNKVDACLRSIYNMSASISFTDLVRRCADKNYIVRANETALVDYARLRNAIIHKSTQEVIIAEPHSNVVEDFERITTLICRPPKITDVFKKRRVIIMDSAKSLEEAVKLITETKYSNIPVYQNMQLKGIVNNKIIVNSIGKCLIGGNDIDHHLKNVSVGSVLDEGYFDTYYLVESKNITLDRIVNHFSQNRKLIAVLITERGTRLESPICIITAYDLMEINEILDNYN